MDMSELGWRDGVLLLAAIAAVYLLLTSLRLLKLRKRRLAPPPVADSGSAVDGPDSSAGTAQWPPQWANQWGGAAGTEASPVADQPAAAEPPAASFDEQLSSSRADQEIRQLREEVGELRRELSELKAARRVSPQYADAMSLARRGYSAQAIADECGLAVAEAELVVAMSRDGLGLDQEVDNAEHARNPAPGR